MSEKWTSETYCTDWASEAIIEEVNPTVVRQIAICGNFSKNGYDIPERAFGGESGVKKLYEGKQIHIDHLEESKLRINPMGRSIETLAGYIKRAYIRDGRPYGDIETKGCQKGKAFKELVRAEVPNTGMSHVAEYKFNKEMTAVESVVDIATVDVVINPATNKSFSEQTKTGDKTMPEGNDAVTELNNKLRSENTDLNSKNVDLESQLKKATDTVSSLESKLAEAAESFKTLESTKNDMNIELDKFKLEAELAGRKDTVLAECKKAGLKDSHVSPEFMEMMTGVDDAKKRESFIKDRAKVYKESGVSGGSFERDPNFNGEGGGEGSEKFSTESAIKEVTFSQG